MTHLDARLLGVMLVIVPLTARADSTFSGSGSSGSLSSLSETWVFNADGGAASTGYLNNWGSPGVGLGSASYGESAPAYGFDITFTGGGPIDPASITLGNSSACAGTTTGGTTFCSENSAGVDVWEAFQVGADSIDFLAQNPSFSLSQGDPYFTNIFFDGTTPTSFTGTWLTNFTPTPPTPTPTITPEPSSLLLLGTGLVGIAGRLGLRFNKRSKTA